MDCLSFVCCNVQAPELIPINDESCDTDSTKTGSTARLGSGLDIRYARPRAGPTRYSQRLSLDHPINASQDVFNVNGP